MVAFESALERDLATLLEFDPDVLSYASQPVEISYEHEGEVRSGFPDFLVRYHSDAGEWGLLCDVKFREELFCKWPELKPRLRGAMAHARSSGLRYHIFTEVEIRTPFLKNARFLLPYRDRHFDRADEELLLRTLESLVVSTPRALLRACAANLGTQALLLPCLWSLIARGAIAANLNVKLTMESEIKCPQAA
jgi:hypothetical protein